MYLRGKEVGPVKRGFAFHVHHDQLMEWCKDYEGRVRYIKKKKPASEQELRLKLFKLIPPELLPAYLNKAGQAYNKAKLAYNKARRVYDNEWAETAPKWTFYERAKFTCDEVWAVYKKAKLAFDKAGQDYEKACQDYEKACQDYLKACEAYETDIEALHKRLCPNCPWDGKTILASSDVEKLTACLPK